MNLRFFLQNGIIEESQLYMHRKIKILFTPLPIPIKHYTVTCFATLSALSNYKDQKCIITYVSINVELN